MNGAATRPPKIHVMSRSDIKVSPSRFQAQIKFILASKRGVTVKLFKINYNYIQHGEQSESNDHSGSIFKLVHSQ
jgi:hypothetical protein